jgi:hypothetical protein
MFDPTRFTGVGGKGGSSSSNNDEEVKKKAAIQQIERWALAMIESETIRNACIISIQEIICGDPSCAPVDTVVVFTFEEYVHFYFAF